MPHDAGCIRSAYAPGYSAADFDPRALAARLRRCEERREAWQRRLAAAQLAERTLQRRLSHALTLGLTEAASCARFAIARNNRQWDRAALMCDLLADRIFEIERAIEDLERPAQEAEERERLSVRHYGRWLQAGGLR